MSDGKRLPLFMDTHNPKGVTRALSTLLRGIKEECEDIHVPKLWYYSEMLFLVAVDVSRVSKPVDTILDVMPYKNIVEISSDENEYSNIMNVLSPLPHNSFVASSSRPQTKTKAQTDKVLCNIAYRLEEPPRVKLLYDAYGENIAEKFKSLPSIWLHIVKKIINDAVFMAESSTLTMDSHIVHRNLSLIYSQINKL